MKCDCWLGFTSSGLGDLYMQVAQNEYGLAMPTCFKMEAAMQRVLACQGQVLCSFKYKMWDPLGGLLPTENHVATWGKQGLPRRRLAADAEILWLHVVLGCLLISPG